MASLRINFSLIIRQSGVGGVYGVHPIYINLVSFGNFSEPECCHSCLNTTQHDGKLAANKESCCILVADLYVSVYLTAAQLFLQTNVSLLSSHI